ncbi:MAG TPA: 3-methyl-2-oxobutanoate hydroxymethyltransferase [Gammaproteobacteria bacterium]|nr:3-methyl-2-oxobutanoate hydroxymethyltransferase [Gammaproteobacteria bacterium]
MSSHKITTPSTVTINTLKQMKKAGEKITCMTAYDASFSNLLDQTGIEVLLVGDSLGMVIQGFNSTLPVTMKQIIYHSRCVAQGRKRALLMVDMPFSSDLTLEETLKNAGRLMKEGGAHIIKLEGGHRQTKAIQALAQSGIPTCGHLGLLPQSVHKQGGYRVQGRDNASAQILLDEAIALEKAGADLLLLECVPATLGTKISQTVQVPVIGIGAGNGCDGQVLVVYDALNITSGKKPGFTKNFMEGANSIQNAIEKYIDEVKNGTFPSDKHSF